MGETDLDGFLLELIFAPTDLVGFAQSVTLREQLMGGGRHLAADDFRSRLTR